jgi:hypothetical protein
MGLIVRGLFPTVEAWIGETSSERVVAIIQAMRQLSGWWDCHGMDLTKPALLDPIRQVIPDLKAAEIDAARQHIVDECRALRAKIRELGGASGWQTRIGPGQQQALVSQVPGLRVRELEDIEMDE